MKQQMQQNMTIVTELNKLIFIKQKYEFMCESLDNEDKKQLSFVLINSINMIVNIMTHVAPAHSIFFICAMKKFLLKNAPNNDETRELISICDNIYALLNLPVLG